MFKVDVQCNCFLNQEISSISTMRKSMQEESSCRSNANITGFIISRERGKERGSPLLSPY